MIGRIASREALVTPPISTSTLSRVEQPARELLITGVVALRIEMDQLDLPPRDAARLVDLLDGKLRCRGPSAW